MSAMALGASSKPPEEEADPAKQIKTGKFKEVGNEGVWTLSSCKPGFGVDQLRDDCQETYWQSDGPQPHLVNISFRRKTPIQEIWIYADYKSDESYTPSKISIRCGTHFNDLQEVEMVDLHEPTGWLMIPLKDIQDKPYRTYMIQIAVLANHQSGRDTHMRQIKILSPVSKSPMAIDYLGDFTSPELKAYQTLR